MLVGEPEVKGEKVTDDTLQKIKELLDGAPVPETVTMTKAEADALRAAAQGGETPGQKYERERAEQQQPAGPAPLRTIEDVEALPDSEFDARYAEVQAVLRGER